ncbi:MAG: hypothetical protein WAL15_25570, partial [Xanthobacteraceae bacterium]
MSTGFDSPKTALEPPPMAQATTAAQMTTLRFNRRPTGVTSPARPGHADKIMVLSTTRPDVNSASRANVPIWGAQGDRANNHSSFDFSSRGPLRSSLSRCATLPVRFSAGASLLFCFGLAFFDIGILHHGFSELERKGVIDDALWV